MEKRKGLLVTIDEGFNCSTCFYILEQIVEEAGGTITCMDGGKFSVFDRSVLVSNGALHGKV